MNGAAGPAWKPRARRFECSAARLASALRIAENAALDFLRFTLWPRRGQRLNRIAVYRIGNVGDTVCALPALWAVRRAYPAASLTLVTSPGRRGAPGAAELLDGARWLDEIVAYHSEDVADRGGRHRMLNELRRREFDAWIELPVVDTRFRTQLRNLLVARALGPRWAAGWAVGPRSFAARAQSASRAMPNEVERLLAIVARLGIEPLPVKFPLPISQADRSLAGRVVNQAGQGRPLVALAPAAKCESNLWPAGRFAEVGRRLAASGFAPVVLGGAADTARCAEIAALIGAPAIDLAGRTTILESAAILERCALAICLDSGLQHLAAAVGTRCLSLFAGKGFRGIWHPYGDLHTVLRKTLECDSCLLQRCPRGNHCMNLIETAEVEYWADRMLAGFPAGGFSGAYTGASAGA